MMTNNIYYNEQFDLIGIECLKNGMVLLIVADSDLNVFRVLTDKWQYVGQF